MASPSAGAPALKYGDVNKETTSPGEVKGLISINYEPLLSINFSFTIKSYYRFRIFYKIINDDREIKFIIKEILNNIAIINYELYI